MRANDPDGGPLVRYPVPEPPFSAPEPFDEPLAQEPTAPGPPADAKTPLPNLVRERRFLETQRPGRRRQREDFERVNSDRRDRRLVIDRQFALCHDPLRVYVQSPTGTVQNLCTVPGVTPRAGQ